MGKPRYILLYPPAIEVKGLNNVNVIDVRRCKFTEIDIIDDPREVIKILGDPIKVINVDEVNESFRDLFFDCRFWEAHEVLERMWVKEVDEKRKKYLQALILLCASMIHYLKGHEKVSDDLLDNALSLISELPEELLPLLYVSVALNS